MKLLVCGKVAFPEIINCINYAQNSIYINMFIWRNDNIGNALVQAVLQAADRGVKVTISKDRYGVVLESCEESMSSFFHRNPTCSEKFKIACLKALYNKDLGKIYPHTEDDGSLLSAISNHRNIEITCINKYDHSKYYLIDEKILIMGGINIEDKENGADLSGRAYHDYMVKVDDKELIDEFLHARQQRISNHFCFNFNNEKLFFMKEAYLKLINDSSQYLTILMAYLSPLKEFESAILNASKRGVKVSIVIPQSANFQDNLNKASLNRLIKKSRGNIKGYLFPGMLHAKLIMNENTISLGSCNLNKKAFNQLGELNLFSKNDGPGFAQEVTEDVERVINISEKIESIDYSSFIAKMESILV